MYATSSHVQQVHHPPYNHSNSNGHVHANGITHHQHPQPTQTNRSTAPPAAKEPVVVVGVPSVSIQNNQLQVGNAQSSSTRSYTPLKVLGDGSFGTVWLCDWHGTLPPNTPLSPMQCGAGARPEWVGKRLVAVKRMKKRWEGGWDECKKLKELESLRAIPFHPNIIPLYDFFLLQASKELYFVFESMEGNLYHLIKARKGRALAGGLVASIFRQIVSGLCHIHACGYFHRDMKPENVLVTTTGLFDYQSVSPVALPNALPEKDVVAIIKLADFGLARETKSKPPYTEYVSTRWYRAPEVLLLSKDYSNPVDMWALGTIMAELVNLRPLFPGSNQIDQVARICEVLGDPNDEYFLDARRIGGGKWSKGVKMAKAIGFQFAKTQPRDFYSLFDRSVPTKLVECIAGLLKYDPDVRLTSRQCLEHPYLLETIPRNNVPMPPALSITTSLPVPVRSPQRNGISPAMSISSISPRTLPPSHSHHSIPRSPHPTSPHLHLPHIPDSSSSHRVPFYGDSPDLIEEQQRSQIWSGESAPPNQGDWYAMDVSPRSEMAGEYDSQPMEIQSSPMAQEHPARPPIDPDSMNPSHVITGHDAITHSPGTKLGKLGSLGFGRKNNRWGLGGMFGHGDKGHTLPPVDEMAIAASSSSTPSLKRTQSSSTDSRSLAEMSPIQEVPTMDPKKAKKEAERLQAEANKQRRALMETAQRDRARAVMEKRRQEQSGTSEDVAWKYHHAGSLLNKPRTEERVNKKHGSSSGPIRQNQVQGSSGVGSATVNAAAGRFDSSSAWRRDERLPKARRREFDDDHSMSSSDVHSLGRVSALSFATVDSDPGPTVPRRPSLFGINRMTSRSSLRTGTSFDDFPSSARSSNSFSVGESLAHDFHIRANVDGSNMLSGSISPPPIQMLSLSPSPTWMHESLNPNDKCPSRREHLNFISKPPTIPEDASDIIIPAGPHYPHESVRSHSSSPRVGPQIAINPMLKVPTERLSSPPALPPFAQLEAVVEGEYPPLSPMSFHNPDEDS